MEVISPWVIYWVLQLDSIKFMFSLAGWLSAIAGGLCLIFSFMDADFATIYEDATYEDGKRQYAKYSSEASGKRRFARAIIPLAVLFLLCNAFVPSTRAMAAIVVIPAIANSTTIQTEAGELYDLAKQALRQAVTDDKPTKSTD